MKNAELIVKMLERAGIRWAFGIPSGPVLPIIEALRKSSIEYVLTASETSAAFMAQAVGAFTGVPGVCISTLGPGATNLTTGVGAAWLDRTPLIAITCNVPIPWLDRRIQMRIDHHALFQPLTKASLPLREGHVAAPLSEALTIACAEPPGPVHLDLPEDVAAATATETVLSPERVGSSLPDISAEVVSRAAEVLAKSRRPAVANGDDAQKCENRRMAEVIYESLAKTQGSMFFARGAMAGKNMPTLLHDVGRAPKVSEQNWQSPSLTRRPGANNRPLPACAARFSGKSRRCFFRHHT